MADRSYLQWPFFAESHREFAGAFEAWLRSHGEVSKDPEVSLRHRSGQAPGHRPEDAAVQHWVRTLANGGWLSACLELDVRKLCLTREMLAYHDALADFAFAMQGLGSGPISLFGTQAQKERYLGGVTSGKTLMAFALSEREAGSDVAAIQTRARRENNAYVLDGEKAWISNAGIAGVYVVFARTADTGSKGLSAFIVEAKTPGVTVPERIETISPHPLGTLRFENVRISVDSLLGKEGEGFKIAMATLDLFRSTVGAAALGFARRALDESVAHVRERQLFGAPMSALQLTQAKIAQMATDIDASALLVYRAAYVKDSSKDRVTREAAMAKWFATETAARVADAAVQLFGGKGVTRGEIVERIYRDVRALRIYEGASEIQQVVIARSILEDR